MNQRPPALAEKLLRRVLPDLVGTEVLDALASEYRERLADRGRFHAGVWYASHLLLPSTWALAARLRARRRDSKRGTGAGTWWLELRIAARLTRRQPTLTVVACLSMAAAVAAAAGFFAFSQNVIHPVLPGPDGDRIVVLRYLTDGADRGVPGPLPDLSSTLTTVEGLGAFRPMEAILQQDGGAGMRVHAAEVTASAFALMGSPPHLGRPLLAEDGALGAAEVVVMGEGLWRRGFGGDAGILGRTIIVGDVPRTVVGIMPDGFRFPFNHELWVPLASRGVAAWGLGDSRITVFGRLAEGITVEQAEAEMGVVWRDASEASPERGAARVRVLPYAEALVAAPNGALFLGRLVVGMVLLLVCANVGSLLFARNLGRAGELAVRAALGAGRRRLVFQLFLEALMLVSLGALLGLAITAVALPYASRVAGESIFSGMGLPFWWREGLGPGTFAFTAALTLLGAIMAGMLPGVVLTRVQLRPQLQRTADPGSSHRMGVGARVAIAGQVAFSVLLLTLAVAQWWPRIVRDQSMLEGLVPREFVGASVRLEGDHGMDAARTELTRRLITEPSVTGVSFATSLPGERHARQRIAVEGQEEVGRTAGVALVAPAYFSVMGTPILAGREFHSGDVPRAADNTATAVVNRSFAEDRLGGAAVGRRIRILSSDGEPGPWLEVVGVVGDLGVNLSNPKNATGVYLPLSPGTHPVKMVVRFDADAADFAGRLPGLAAGLNAPLRIVDAGRLDHALSVVGRSERMILGALSLVVLSILLLTMSGLYALMAYHVAQRRREIGIRRALGAMSTRVAGDVLGRALTQLGPAAALGIVLSVPMASWLLEDGSLAVALTVAGSILLMGLIACARPLMVVLRVRPLEAMRGGV